MNANFPIWQSAIWITLGFVIISLIMQFYTRRAYNLESLKMNRLISQNKKLSDNILALQNQLVKLNYDLVKLSEENKKLKKEVEMLHIRVSNLQVQVSKTD